MTAVIDRLHRSRIVGRPLLGLDGHRATILFRDAEVTPDHLIGLLVWTMLAPLVAIVAGFLHGWVVSGATVVAAVAVPVGLIGARSGRRTRRLVEGLPSAIDLIGRSLRSGASFRQSLDEAGRSADAVVGEEFHGLLRDAATGRPMATVIADWASAHQVAELRIVGAALLFAAENEAGTSQALEGLSQTLRDRRALRGEIRALTAQASASMLVLVAIPVGLVLVGLAAGSRSAQFLFETGLGRACLTVGLALDGIGWLWMRRLVRVRLP